MRSATCGIPRRRDMERGLRPAVCVCVTLFTVLSLAAPAAAQYYERPLTDQDLQKLVPVLQADRTGTERLARQLAARDALERERAKGRQAAANQVAAGTDPLEWLTKATPNAVAPSTARYQATCSHALTAADVVPSAVFSFGIAAPPSWLAVWRARDRSLPIGERGGPEKPGGRRPGATTPETVTQQTRAFYASRGFEYVGETAPFEWQFAAPDRLVGATVMGVNVLGRVEACGDLPSGPTVVLKAEGEAFGKAPAAPAPSTNTELANALDKAGLTESQYLNLKLQLLNAKADAQDPSRLKSAPESTVAIRRQNAEFYRRHADVLAPLLEGMQPDA